jgi:hypothetical protein
MSLIPFLVECQKDESRVLVNTWSARDLTYILQTASGNGGTAITTDRLITGWFDPTPTASVIPFFYAAGMKKTASRCNAIR